MSAPLSRRELWLALLALLAGCGRKGLPRPPAKNADEGREDR